MMRNVLAIIVVATGAISCGGPAYTPGADALFTRLSAGQSGIGFRNDVEDDSVFNEASYRNFYNGGGVAIGDLNNDGLPDIFMTANQGMNRLYANRGNLKFEDITQEAGIIKKQKWSTGVTMADVNGDGLLDIYVCAAGNGIGDRRKNILYINKGNFRFDDETEQYHLADEGGYHTQATFFDYDMDGDLDVFLLTNDCTVPTSSFPDAFFRTEFRAPGGDKLLKNDHGVYTDVSESAGIFGAKFGFGLGISVGDVNGDMWPDIYISNDFFEKDYLYINRGNGTFAESSDSSLAHMSQTSMGADIADVNNDGLMDIFSTDMLPEDDYRLKKNTRFDDYDTYKLRYKSGYHHQILSNMLQINNGDNTFSEIAQYSGVNATDWSWGALIVDLDNDGWKDIFVCNGMYLDITDNDYIDYIGGESKNAFLKKSRNISDYEMLKSLPVAKRISNYALINNHNLTFENKSSALGLGDPGFSNGAAYGDLDNDGDMDLVINNLNDECFVYRNNTTERLHKSFIKFRLAGSGKNTYGIGTSITVFTGGVQQTLQNFPSRGFMSSVDPIMNFGLGYAAKIDSAYIVWPDQKTQHLYNLPVRQTITVRQTSAKDSLTKPLTRPHLFENITSQAISGNIRHTENDFVDFDIERLMPHLLSTEGPKAVVGDINGDGLADFVVGSARHDTTKVFLQHQNGTFVRATNQPDLARDADFEDAQMILLDVDGDGDSDLIIANGGNMDSKGSSLLQPRVYLNNHSGTFVRDDQLIPKLNVNASCIKSFDFDGDGFTDIFIGGRSVPGKYGDDPQSILLHNDHGHFTEVTEQIAPELAKIGMVTDAAWADIDNDGRPELILVGEWMPVTVFVNSGTGFHQTEKFRKQFAYTNGWWNCIVATDIDHDGQVDLVAGNWGLNTKIKADSAHPARLYMADFDGNGTRECIVTTDKKDGKSYPYYLKNDITAQMPALKKKLLKHADYAGLSIDQIFDTDQLKNASVKEAYEFKSCIFQNTGQGNFDKRPLPPEVQFSPIFAILVDDFDHDGVNDMLLAGNFSGLKPELGRYDANYGTYLQGKRHGGFEYVPPVASGFFYRGEARDLLSIPGSKGRRIIMTRNNDDLIIFQTKHK